SPGFRRWKIRDFAKAYSSGEITPVMVARRFLAAVEECSGPDLNMALFISYDPEDIVRQAEESTLRYQQGAPLSAMDGVLVAVKDEIDCLPYQTTGSVRMPAALCGVVGFKPTAGRLSNSGLLPLNWTVGVPGILAATVEDALIAYAAMVDQSRPAHSQPQLNLPMLTSTHCMPNIRLARYGKWFNDSSDNIRGCCDKALQILRAHYGWETVDVTVPEVEEMRLAHYVTMGAECSASLAAKYLEKLDKSEIGWDVRIALSAYGSFSSRAYLNAQRIRNRQMYFHNKIFETADAIVTPMTGVTAYALQDDALRTGELDYINAGGYN
uniref:Amidase domain-containing protein n=1 Tax=Aegilops tauschii subsp. strangulata TaxID=200361 RepID=A0A453HLY4_AEGTS